MLYFIYNTNIHIMCACAVRDISNGNNMRHISLPRYLNNVIQY